MKELLIIAFLIAKLLACSQDSEFKDLISMFEKEGTTIPTGLALKYFEHKSTDRKLTTSRIVHNNERFISLSAFSVGLMGYGEGTRLVSFDRDGNRIDEIEFESKSHCFEGWRKLVIESDSLLVFNEWESGKNCTGINESKNEQYRNEFIFIESDGNFSPPFIKQFDSRRENLEASLRLLTSEDLSDKSKEELGTMRNEIFASYGYIFKSPKWKRYFGEKAWYLPIAEDVTKKLSFIERRNVQLIYKLERE